MKTIKNHKEIKRVSDKEAHNLVTPFNDWSYCPKHVWKTEVRGPIKNKEPKEIVEK